MLFAPIDFKRFFTSTFFTSKPDAVDVDVEYVIKSKT